METTILKSLYKLNSYCEGDNLKGYDPYDTLNSWFPFYKMGKWPASIAIQIQKRNPINIRPILGIKKGWNPKGMGLFLKAYCLLYRKTGKRDYLNHADWLFEWLLKNYSNGYSGMCWGYNFNWVNPGGSLPAFVPSVVVTSFVIDGIYEYFKITGNPTAAEAIHSAANYINNDIPITKLSEGISYAYTNQSKGCCYNASLLAAEILAKSDFIGNKAEFGELIKLTVDFVLSKQKPDGEWWYSYNPETNSERKQIDFHQGFVLVSLNNLLELSIGEDGSVKQAIEKGLRYYKNNQFYESGRSLWRIPKKWPVEIHNQSQGIITFSKLSKFDTSYSDFASKIANWTIDNMQSPKGYFYYRKNPFFMNKISYIRWSQAWMMLALAEIIGNH